MYLFLVAFQCYQGGHLPATVLAFETLSWVPLERLQFVFCHELVLYNRIYIRVALMAESLLRNARNRIRTTFPSIRSNEVPSK